MFSLAELIAKYEERYAEALASFEEANEMDDEEEALFWEAEVVITRDTLAYLKTLNKFQPATPLATRAN